VDKPFVVFVLELARIEGMVALQDVTSCHGVLRGAVSQAGTDGSGP